MIFETKKILNDWDLKVTATCVRVPVYFGHSESINIEFEKPCTVEEVRKVLENTEGVVVQDDVKNNVYPMPIFAENKNEVFVGRIRKDDTVESGINIWVVADNIRKGAATNAVQIAEKAIEVSDGKKVLDLCTGSGAIAIAIKKEKPAADVFATDISEPAISLAKENAENNGAEIKFSVGDLFGDLKEKFDVIVSNPPYIKSGDINNLQTEVKDFEPIIALDGGEDGLSFYRRICSESVKYLNKGGILLLECGFDQAKDIIKLLKDFSSVNIIKDYEGIDRIVKAEL